MTLILLLYVLTGLRPFQLREDGQASQVHLLLTAEEGGQEEE